MTPSSIVDVSPVLEIMRSIINVRSIKVDAYQSKRLVVIVNAFVFLIAATMTETSVRTMMKAIFHLGSAYFDPTGTIT